MSLIVTPKDMRTGAIYPSKNWGDFLVTFYKSARKVGIYFLNSKNESIVHASQVRSGLVKDRVMVKNLRSNRLTQDILKKMLSYNPGTGVFVWNLNRKAGVMAGDIAGCVAQQICGKSYRLIGIFGVLYGAHRLAFLYMEGSFPGHEVDHGDGNGLNNKWDNLSKATSLENKRNQRRHSNNTSGVTGVEWDKLNENWRSKIGFKGKAINIGSFPDFNDAVIARKMMEYKLGFHDNHDSIRPL